MSRKSKWLLVFSLVLGLIFFQIICFKLENKKVRYDEDLEFLQRIKGLHIQGSDEKGRGWELSSKVSEYKVGREFALKGVKADFLFEGRVAH